ncbi:MAG: hypothetical protein ACFFC7_32860, partial [Candidatus Hermodarchaeota archaeon]
MKSEASTSYNHEFFFRGEIINFLGFAIFILICFVPLILAVVDAFQVNGQLGFANFQSVFNSIRILRILGRSIFIAASSAFLALLLAVPVAFFIDRAHILGGKLLLRMGLIPLLIAPGIHAGAWIWLFPSATIWKIILIFGTAYYPIVLFLT